MISSSKKNIQNYLVDRIEVLEKEHAFQKEYPDEEAIIQDEKIIKIYGEYLALTKALYDLFEVVY